MDIKEYMQTVGRQARAASRRLAGATTAEKNAALLHIAAAIRREKAALVAANQEDLAAARAAGLDTALLDRLTLSEKGVDGMAEGVEQVATLADPIGEMTDIKYRPSGIQVGKMRVPLGVIGIIYEARPNVTVDAAALCLKSGNACILRGGKEAIRSNTVLADIMRGAIESAGLPADCVALIHDTSRESAKELMGLRDYIDVLIPRGGAGLIDSVVQNASVPVIETGRGNCHVYVDDDADLEMAANIVENAKCSRPSVCNAMETLLVSEKVAAKFLPLLLPRLQKYSVELRCDEKALKILGDAAIPATEADWGTEYDDYILAVKVVSGIDEAMDHIACYGSGHSEAIVTTDYAKSQRFLREVDAAAVYVNASTRFTDGGEFGLGAEIGISTQKLHARGPMGVRELTSCKYVIYGSGQIR